MEPDLWDNIAIGRFRGITNSGVFKWKIWFVQSVRERTLKKGQLHLLLFPYKCFPSIREEQHHLFSQNIVMTVGYILSFFVDNPKNVK